MARSLLFLMASALVLSVFAGCLGSGDDLDRELPVALVTVTPVTEGLEPDDVVDTFVFDASASTGAGLRFDWSFGDGSKSDRPVVTHTYTYGTDTYDVELLLTDAFGVTVRWHDDVVVGTGVNHPPTALFTPSARYLGIGEPFTVDARRTYDPDGDGIVYEWDFNHLPMDLESYYHFREKKAGGSSHEDNETDVSSGKSAPLPEDLEDLVEDIGGLLYKHTPDGGNEPPPSYFDGRRSTTEPVFTLQEGFPEATRFYVRLAAIDTKGAFEAVVSEEIWPVEVVSSKIPEIHQGERTGNFTHGAPATVRNEIPDDDAVPLVDSTEWPFEIPGVLNDLGRDEDGDRIPALWVNVTWSQHPLYAEGDLLPNRLSLELLAPSGDLSDDDGADLEIHHGITAAAGADEGAWVARLVADQGLDIEWTMTYWAIIDLNPFRALESDFV